MAVMVRERWTDERLDEAFGRIDADIRELRVEVKRGFERVDKRFERVDDKFDAVLSEMNTRFDAMQRTMIIGFVTLFASIVGCVVGALFAV
ncbi:MAG TPA: hypothetical protein VFT79_08920 [Solirubrobacterales bacterium]|nr:hypothetical protein [Solirubrobacterales bacterium]